MVEPWLAGLDLLKRIPPKENNIEEIAQLFDSKEFIEKISKKAPANIKIATDDENNEFICCEFNKTLTSYRSPWTNNYVPEISGGLFPSGTLR